MSVTKQVYRVFGSEIDPLRQASEEQIERLLFGPEGGTGWEMDPDRKLGLDKAWEALNYALAGSSAAGPLTFLVSETIGESIDYEFTYGPGRLIEPARVKEIAASISALSRADVEARLDDAATMEGLYPFSGGYTPRDRNWVAESLSELMEFIARAAKLDCGLLVGSA